MTVNYLSFLELSEIMEPGASHVGLHSESRGANSPRQHAGQVAKKEIQIPEGRARTSPRDEKPAAPGVAGSCSPRLVLVRTSFWAHLEIAHHGGAQGTQESRPQDQPVKPLSDPQVPELVVTDNADPGGWEEREVGGSPGPRLLGRGCGKIRRPGVGVGGLTPTSGGAGGAWTTGLKRGWGRAPLGWRGPR